MVQRLPKITHLKALKLVAHYGSINAAAKATNIPQPTLSRTIRELEEILNVSLVVRGRQGVSLTSAGLSFAAHASFIVAQLEAATQEARTLGGGDEYVVHFGVSPISANSILDEALGRLIREFEHCNISVEDNPLELNLSRVRDGTLDFAIGNAGADVSLSDFMVEPLMDCPFAVVCKKGHPLENATRLEQLINANWWVTGEFKVCQQTMSMFNDLGRNQSFYTRSHIAGLPMIFNHGFVALLSSVQVKKYRQKLSVIPIKNLNVVGHYVLVYKKNAILNIATKRLINYLHYEANNFDWNDFGTP